MIVAVSTSNRVCTTLDKPVAFGGSLWFVGLLFCVCGSEQLHAQTTLRSSPYLPFRQPEPAKYNLKWGRLQARVTGEVQSEFNDNINLAQTGKIADWSIGPNIGIGFIYPMSKDHLMQFSVGAGYRWYLNSPSISSFSVAPNSSWSHTITIGAVTLDIHDQFSIQVDPTARGDISGAPNQLVNFRLINNTCGLLASYQPTLHWTLTAGYDYSIARSLTDQFQELDSDTHTFSAGTYYAINPRITTGVTSSYSLTEHLKRVQNNGDTWSIGPVLSIKPTAHIYMQFSVAYTMAGFDQSGTILDRSNFEGLTFQAAVNHQLNRKISHSIRLTRSIAPGLGSNYGETTSAQYGISLPLSRSVTLTSNFGYENLVNSGVGSETSDRYIFYLGTGYQITKKWTVGVSYALAWKDSSQAGRDYVQNRVTLGLVRQF